MEKTASSSVKKRALSTSQMALIGVMTAVTCILGPFAIPIPISPVPISFTNLAVYLTVYVLGMKAGTISYLIYLLLGFAGLPVFSGFTGGVAKLAGPTGGYLVGFIFMAVMWQGWQPVRQYVTSLVRSGWPASWESALRLGWEPVSFRICRGMPPK